MLVVMRLFLMVPLVGLRSLIVAFPAHTHLLISITYSKNYVKYNKTFIFLQCLSDSLAYQQVSAALTTCLCLTSCRCMSLKPRISIHG